MEVIDGLPNADYHSRPELGSTSLKTLARPGGPAKWKWEQEHPRKSTAFDVGSVAHSLILEGDESGVTVIDVDTKRGKVWTEGSAEARESGKIPLTTMEWREVVAMRDAVMAHPLAKRAFTGHVPERSIFWKDTTGLGLKCRPDALHPNLIVDLKTTTDASPAEFGRTAYKFGYFQSAAHYQDGVAEAYGEVLPFLFVNAEKSAPHLVSVVELDEEAIDYGRQMNNRAAAIYHDCTATDTWPGYPTTEAIRLPKFAVNQLEGELYE